MKKKQEVISIPKSPNFELYLIRDTNVSWTELSSEIALVNIQKSSLYTLNATGALIWKLTNGKHTLVELVNKLAAEYDVSEQGLKKDIWNLACKLVKADLASFSQKPTI